MVGKMKNAKKSLLQLLFPPQVFKSVSFEGTTLILD